MQKATLYVQEFDNTLSDREAVALVGTALAAAGVIADTKSIMRGVKNIFSKIDGGSGLAYATADGMKFNADDFDSKFDNILYKDRTDLPESVRKVGDRYPINADKAGKVYHVNDLPEKVKTNYPDIDLKYPDGVRFDEFGFPDFKPYATHIIKLDKFSNYKSDVSAAPPYCYSSYCDCTDSDPSSTARVGLFTHQRVS